MNKAVLSVFSGILLLTTPAFSQDFKRDGKEYSSVKSERTATSDEKSGFTYRDSKGEVHDIYISKSGSCYIYRVSAKTGKKYKAYLGKEISADICKQLGREYTPSK